MSVTDPFGNRLTFTYTLSHKLLLHHNADHQGPSLISQTNRRQEDRPMRLPLLHLYFTMCMALMLTSCVTSPSPEEMTDAPKTIDGS
jgi:YD repeat-containing protein